MKRYSLLTGILLLCVTVINAQWVAKHNMSPADYQAAFTDDASVVERSGVDIHMIDGNYTNIKITFPEDILMAEMILGK